MNSESIVKVLAGGGVFAALSALIQFFFTRHDKSKERDDKVMKAIEAVDEKLNKHIEDSEVRELKQIRIRIIRLADDIVHGVPVSDEMLDNGMDDVNSYEKGCETHPHFKNSKAEVSIGVVKKKYAEPRNV